MGRVLRWVLVIAAIVWCGVALALPPLEHYRGYGLELQVPRGWTVTVDEAAGTVLVAEDPNDPMAAAMVLLAVPYQPGLDAAFLTQAVLAEVAPSRTELGREVVDGVVWTLQSFDAEGVPALLTSLAISNEGGDVVTIALLSAQPDAFEVLGGTALLLVTFAAADPALFEQPASVHGAGGALGSFPRLEPIAELGGAYLKPAGWHYTSERAPGQDLIYLLEDPADEHSAAILFLSQVIDTPPTPGTDVVEGVVASFTQALGIGSVSVLRRSGDDLNGARLLLGTRFGRQTKAFFAVFSDAGSGRVYGVIAPAERFDAFGGHGLMWITLGGMSVAAFEASAEMQAWYQPAGSWSGFDGDGGSAGSLAAQQMLLEMQSRMFMSWSNNLGGSTHCWGDSYGCY